MSNFSQHGDYSIILDDTMSSISTDTITLTSNYTTGSTITIDSNYNYNYGVGSLSSSVGVMSSQMNTISSIDISNYKINIPEEWVNTFPDFDRIESMCKEYPGLKIAYDQFKTVYALVKGDYDTPKDQRIKP